MEVSVVTTKGQVVIPAKIRKKFGIGIGTQIEFYEENGEIKLIPINEESIDRDMGMLKTKGRLLKVLTEEKKTERGT